MTKRKEQIKVLMRLKCNWHHKYLFKSQQYSKTLQIKSNVFKATKKATRMALKFVSKFTRKHLCQSLFNKIADLQSITLLRVSDKGAFLWILGNFWYPSGAFITKRVHKPFHAWSPLKGHTYLNKHTDFSCRFF